MTALLCIKISLSAHVFQLLQVHQGKLHESESRRYFQELIDAVDYCHSKHVYHRDLKVCCVSFLFYIIASFQILSFEPLMTALHL